MFQFYLKLQIKMLNRIFNEWGLNPILAYIMFFSAFLGLSFYLFYKIEFAFYLYPLLALGILSPLSNKNRNEFLLNIFRLKRYKLLRICENIAIVCPFSLFLVYKNQYLIALLLTLIALLMASIKLQMNNNLLIPNPYFKYPFEFTVGFRKSFLLIIFAYLLCFIAIKVNNFNLGLFSIILIALCTGSFYLNPERFFYVWIFSGNAKTFLLKKIYVATYYLSLTVLPLILALSFFFPAKILVIMLFLFIALLIQLSAVLSKYSAYPYELSIKKSLALLLSIWLPVLLFILIPYFFIEAKKQLKDILL